MPKREPSEPRAIRPFSSHGVDFFKRDDKEWVGTCPFCKKPKFYVNSEDGRFTCYTCPSSGWDKQFPDIDVPSNAYGFIRYVWRVSYNNTKLIDYSWLSAHRGLSAELMREWGICKSITTGEWLVPGYGVKDPPNITQLYIYKNIKHSNGEYKYELLPTPGFAEGEAHGVILPRQYVGNANRLYLTEGVWDAVALSGALPMVREDAIRGDIIAAPGCGIFKKQWVKYTQGKELIFLFDNDHYRINKITGLPEQPALVGTKRATSIVYNGDPSTRANSVSWLDWNMDGKGYNPDLPDGYDIRDWVKDGKDINRLLSLVRPVPKEWLGDESSNDTTKVEPRAKERIKPIPCRSYKEVKNAFRLAAKWTPELDGALACSFACAASVNGIGEPLWLRLISPPSTYKSQLCKALGTNDKYIIMDDGLSGFFSGADKGDGKDYSLVTKWNGKCLITKEGATLFTNSDSERIIGEARAIYDREIDRTWRNGKQCIHRDWRGTWILAGTPNMKDYDDNELGPRFIDYRIVKNITEELSDDIVMRAIEEQCDSGIAGVSAESAESIDYLRARQLCGGYLTHLRQDIDDGSIILPSLSQENKLEIATLSSFVESMRSRPPKKMQSENAEKAVPARVSKQLVKLARFLAVVLQKTSVDNEVMNIVYKVAMDTSDGWSFEIAGILDAAHRDGDDGLEPKELANRCNKSLKEIESLFMYLPKIGVLDLYTPRDMPFPVRQARLRLTNSFRKLYTTVKNLTNR